MVSLNLTPKEHKRNGNEIEITTSFAAAIFLAYAILVYWPVLLGQRFFWEDFFIQEYPIRAYSFHMLGIQHVLPFWNPYSWSWEPLLSDAQSAFWYPSNLLGIGLVRLLLPNASHLPILVPEILTLLHLPLGALGVFILLRDRFRVTSIAALLAGLAWGFGARMIAEQNHPMEIIQLALLPWEAILTIRSWNSIRSSISLGILLGISFLAGQPQTFLLTCLFLGTFSIWESIRLSRIVGIRFLAAVPTGSFCLACIIASGVAAIQLLPLIQLTSLSLRQHLSYTNASMGSMHPLRFITFFVPKFFGEFPSYSIPASAAYRANGMWYWEGIFYWGTLAEVLALFGIIRLWKWRKSDDPRARYVGFFVGFSIFAILYALGSYGGIQWLFWRFIPIFDHIRMPNRMLWFFWFIGSIATAFGIEEIMHDPTLLDSYKRYFYWSSAIFIFLNALSMTGVFQIFIRPHQYIQAPSVILHSLIASILSLVFFYLFIRRKLSFRWFLPCAAALIILDLYYVDFTWHRNTLDREMLVARDSISQPIVDFKRLHGNDHSKLLMIDSAQTIGMQENLGMFLRLPMEFSVDSNQLLADNPMRLVNLLPPIQDSIRRMEVMGVSMRVTPEGREYNDSLALPFLKLYHNWKSDDNAQEEGRILNDPFFDFNKTIVVTGFHSSVLSDQITEDSIHLDEFSENELKITTHSDQASMLFENDLYYPAWRAWVDERPTPIFRAFGSLRAVYLDAGTHRIVMKYESTPFEIGWKITITTLVMTLITLCIPFQKKLIVARYRYAILSLSGEQYRYSNDKLETFQ